MHVFADAQVLSYGADPLAIKLLEASNTGQLCSTINEYGGELRMEVPWGL